MAGGWVGYIYVFIACGATLLLIAGSTVLLYVVARVRGRRSPEPRVTVSSVSTAPDGDDGS